MRTTAAVVVDRVQEELRGDGKCVTVEQWVARTWLAWNWSYGSEQIGHQSFSWIAMLSFFEALEVHAGRQRDPFGTSQLHGWQNESEGVEGMVDEAGDEEEVSTNIE